MTSRLRHITLILTLLCSGLLYAQPEHIRFENISTQQGTLHRQISCMMEDHLGYIWFGTQVGLFRYDGYELKGYRHEVNDTTTLSSPTIRSIAEDQDGQIWISTAYGINLLDRRTGTFKHFQLFPDKLSTKGGNTIHLLYVDRSNRLWAIGKLNRYLFEQFLNPLFLRCSYSRMCYAYYNRRSTKYISISPLCLA